MLGLLVILSLSLSLYLRLSSSLSSLVIANVLLFPMMYNMWGLTWFWDDLKALYWKCWSDDGMTDRHTDRISTCRLDPSSRRSRVKTKHVWKYPHILTWRKCFMHPPPIIRRSQKQSRITFPFNTAAFQPAILILSHFFHFTFYFLWALWS